MAFFLATGFHAAAQYDKVAALGSDSTITPLGGPASAPPIENWPYRLPDLRPVGLINDRFPAWLQFGLEERLRWEFFDHASFDPRASDSYLLNRLRFGLLIRPAAWFRVVTQLQDARSAAQTPPIGPPNDSHWDLKLAYAELGDLEKYHFNLRVGRQEIDYNDTMIANSEWRNQGRSYDAVLFNMRLDRFRLGLFSASAVTPLESGLSHHQPGNDIHGIYAGIDRILPHSTIEPFLLWRLIPATPGKSHREEKAIGIRVRGKEIGPADYRIEFVKEIGKAGSRDISAWGTTLGAGYRFRRPSSDNRVFAGFDYASGQSRPSTGPSETFDPMYPTAHDRFGIADQFGWQNILSYRFGLTLEPVHRWSVTTQYLDFFVATKRDAVYASTGVVTTLPAGTQGTHLAREVDLYTWYEVNREIQIGVGVGHVIPSPLLANAGRGAACTYPYVQMVFLDGKRVH